MNPKPKLRSGMILRISKGNGAYGPKGKWASLIRVISVATHTMNDVTTVTGFQYQTIASRGGDHHSAEFMQFNQSKEIVNIGRNFDDWWETFNPKVVV